jgi:signal transduction histidine kinase
VNRIGRGSGPVERQGATLPMRVAVAGVVVFLATTALVLPQVLGRMQEQATTDALDRTAAIAAGQATELERDLAAIWTLVDGLRMACEAQVAAGTADRRIAVDALVRSLAARPEVLGHAYTFAPDAFDGRDAAWAGAPWHDASGRFAPYVVRSGATIAVEVLRDYDTPGLGDWFVVPRRTGRPLLQEPYTYAIDGRSVLMTTISLPVRDAAGGVLGVVTADLALDGLQTRIAGLHPLGRGSGHAVLVSAAGTVLAHGGDAALIGRPATEAVPGWRGAGDGVRSRRPDGVLVEHAVRIGPDAVWRLGVVAEDDAMLAGYRRAQVGILLLLGLYLAATLVLLPWAIHHLLARPLRDLERALAGAPEHRVADRNRGHELTRAAAAAEAVLDRLGAVLDGLGDGVVTVDGDGRVERANPAALALLQAGPAPTGAPLARLLGGGGADAATAIRAACLAERRPWDGVVAGPGGRIRVDARPLARGSGAVVLLHSLAAEDAARDEIERRGAALQEVLTRSARDLEAKVEERTGELVAAQRRLAATAHRAGMAEIAVSVLHNVGNALTSVVIGAAELRRRAEAGRTALLGEAAAALARPDAARWLAEDPAGRRFPELLSALAAALAGERRDDLADLDRLAAAVEHIRHIVATQQAWASGQRLAEPLDLAGIVREALSLKAGACRREGIQIVADLPPLPFTGERHRLLQVLLNIIGNAVDAMRGAPERRLRITATVAAGRIALAIADSGHGIAAADLSRLFTFGFTTRPDGHGFGLHSCRIEMQAMGGTIHAASDGPGRGAVFTVEIPLGQDG